MTAPTILVKKADGSLVRLTLDEVKKMKGQKSASPPGQSLSNHILEEELPPGAPPEMPRLSPSRRQEVELVVAGLSFKTPDDLHNRLRTAVQLYLKDIRSEDETRDILGRAADKGGLNFVEKQIDEIIKLCKEAVRRSAGVATVSAPRPLRSRAASPGAIAGVPLVLGEEHLAVATPNAEVFKLNSQPAFKTVMHDVVAKPAEFGPIEEIRYVTLTDFRRLSHNAVEAAARLKQKFINLQGESILLFLDALDAWRQSPLYQEYVKLINNYLNNGAALSAVAQNKNELQLPEIAAIVQMEKELSVV